MSESIRTAACVVVAAALASAAWVFTPGADRRDGAGAAFAEIGQPFAPNFADPLAARSVEVVSFDEATAAYRAFKVEFDGKRWTIPSHHGYPADAQQKMAEAASSLIGLTKEQVVSDSTADHQALGVLTPDDDAAALSGRGTRVTFRDANGAVLTDLILGKEMPASAATEPFAEAAPTKRYVRAPGKARVYATTLKAGFSTKFADWIETDLLRLSEAGAEPVSRVDIFRSRLDERTGEQQPAERVTLSRIAGAQPPAAQWTLEADPGGALKDMEMVNSGKVEELLTALKGVKIVGVRPKPANLVKALGGGPEARGVQLNAGDLMSLRSRGFFLTQDGRLVANEGQMQVRCTDGVVYTLWFGEVAVGAGEALSSGVGAEPNEQAKPDAAPGAAAGESRYAFITTSFDESAFPPAETAESVRKAAPDATDETVEARVKQSREEREGKIKAGRERASRLGSRFAEWYYVVDAGAFARLRPTRADLVAPRPSVPTPGPAGGSAPAGPALPGPAGVTPPGQ